MLRRLGIRAKVLAVLALPVLVLLVASAYISVQSVSQARTASAVNRVVQVLPDYAIAIEALQQERTLSMQQVDGDALSGSMAAARKNTDASLIALTEAASALDLSGLDPRVGEAIAAAQNSRSRLSNVREQVDAETIPQALVDSNFTDMITAHNDVPALVAETLSDRSLASRLTAYGQVAGTIERVLRTQPIVLEVLADDGSDPDEVREMAALFAVADEARATARTTTNNLRLNDIQLPSRSADLTAMQIALSNGNQLNISTMDSVRWNTLVNAELNSLRAVSGDLLTSADDRAQALASAAARESAITIGITIAATALSIVIAFLVSRGIVIPLRRLTSAAGEVREELPRLVEQVAEPGKAPDLSLAEIPVTSQDEVGRLAAAFNSVNATTIQVARDQAALRGSIAEMFVNVARRDQVLLGRQLAFIDSLERSEEDPATLANLFRLDHLATRMRRNAESLLVLAGIDSGRRLREAMPLSDVVRTASSEIEQYDRVQLDLGVDPLMHGFNALAAAHLMAELLENATLFSEPGTPVFVRTDERTGERSGDRQVLVTIVDQGLGMSDEELAEANATIAAAAATDAIGAQRLGLYVVARLATRLGASVTLSRVTDGGSGTVATVAFPGQLFTAEPTAAGDGLAAAATGAVPVVEQPEAPAAVPVDLASLTDGATGTGLPRRRTGAPGPDVPAGPSVVLPVPTATTLSPEITSAPTGWAPAVPADGGAALPGRGSVLPTRGSGLPTRQSARSGGDRETTTTENPTGPRAGLFAGFRGRAALDGAQSASQPGLDGPGTTRQELSDPVEETPAVATTPVEQIPVAAAPVEQTPVELAPAAAPVDEARAVTDPVVTDPVATDPVEEQRSAFIVPALMPDDEPVDPSWGEQAAWGEPLAVNSLGEPVLDQMPETDPTPLVDPRSVLEPSPLGEWAAGTPALADHADAAPTRDEPPFAVPEPFAPIGVLDAPAEAAAAASADIASADAVSVDAAHTASVDADTPADADADTPADADADIPADADADIPAAAPVPPVERVELPDFASVVRGDGTDDLPAPRRERGNKTRRPLLSFGRRRRAVEPRA
ncbi:nitrate- and nitrite sensing domain-containing protein, partial [Cellulomonas sp. RIT-PI-Y]|uniref:sensor histidine kinase n=1 Tax=Cellulomonas sp. RIT-PI-Y TaxID=3035297 RepID=UPI0021DB56D8